MRGPRTGLWCLAWALLLGAEAAAQGRGRRERPRVPVDEAQQAVLQAAPDQKLAAFATLMNSFSRAAREASLPATHEQPEVQYGPEYVELRRRCYGPLRADPATLEFLHAMASDPAASTFEALTVCLFLSDEPLPADLEALLAGYEAVSRRDGFLTSRARYVGRATRALRDDPARETQDLVAYVFELLRAQVAGDDGYVRGAAIEGLYRAGEEGEALAALRRTLGSSHDPEQALEVLQSCPRLVERRDFDPFLKAKALDVARSVAERGIADGLTHSEVTRSVTNAAAGVRAAIQFLERVAPETQVDFFVRCFTDPQYVSVLGMDGIQDARMALQAARRRLPEERGRELDALFAGVLAEAGERLFALEEEPMGADEYREYHRTRDLRYNAAAYLCDLWDGVPGVRASLGEDPELPGYLEILAGADRLTQEGEEDDALYFAVKEKTETRVLCAELLGRFERDLGRAPEEVDLYPLLVRILTAEVSADEEATLAALETQRAAGSPDLHLEIPVVREPGDAWVKNRAIEALEVLGCQVADRRSVIEISLPGVVANG